MEISPDCSRSRSPLLAATRRCASLAFGLAALITVAPAGLVLDNGFELGVADWDTTGVWKPSPSDATSFTASSREGTKSVRFVPHADRKQVRSEMVLRPPFNDTAVSHGTQTWDGKFNWGTEYWEGFSIRVVAPLDGFGIICQHHSVPALVDRPLLRRNVTTGEVYYGSIRIWAGPGGSIEAVAPHAAVGPPPNPPMNPTAPSASNRNP